MSRAISVALFSSSLSVAGVSQAAEVLRVAADAVPHAEILQYIQKNEPNLKLRIIEISSGVNSNELLAHGDVDANYFQHVPYLRAQEQALGREFAIAATVHIEPLGIYSSKYRQLSELPDKARVAVPNNVTNLSRALYLLQDQGLITLKKGFNDPARDQATPKDIADNPKSLEILEVESPLIPRALADVDLGVINGNYALEAGLVPAKDALALESEQNNPYANILVTTPELAEDPRIRKLADELQSPEVAAFIKEKYAGSVIPVRDGDTNS
ncbi:MetQ/NlpA family ABC transporter substrate-binding protein [Zobellella sp. CGMCC 1.18722]|uniref:Lipoprotein n=2 Tax=Zobellella iuensis TaxID=2803811 RepID=A0ABS1QNZ1_9GAMM|nr:MetQ/NlpA family ABC transporter substrate-binding protein [Zobellella iuensis]